MKFTLGLRFFPNYPKWGVRFERYVIGAAFFVELHRLLRIWVTVER